MTVAAKPNITYPKGINLVIIVTTAVSAAVLELRHKNPTVDLKLIKRTGNLRVGMLLNFIVRLVLFGTVFTWPILTQISLGWPATMTGESLMPRGIYDHRDLDVHW